MLGLAIFGQRNEPRSLTRHILAIFSALALVLGFTLASTPSAHAVTTCTNLSPAIGEVVTCTGAGGASINIPAGARGVRIVAVGGGGGGAEGAGVSTPGGAGGAGARVVGTFALSGGGTLSAQVGAGGAGGDGVAAGGGAFSRVQLGSTDLVISGGGGGGGFANVVGKGGTGAANGTAAGGDGASSGGSTGGRGGSAGIGGIEGTGTTDGEPGSDYPDGAGGGGGTLGGHGGTGYGGGGSGGDTNVENTAAGGGAGGSFANPTLLVGTASFSPSAGGVGSGEPGSGGEGGIDGSRPAGEGKPGTAGLIEITFLDTLPGSSQVPPPILQQFGLPADGECESGATQEMNWAGVESGGWGKSWAQWMNDGAGGAVCTRTLIYNPARARWMVEGT